MKKRDNFILLLLLLVLFTLTCKDSTEELQFPDKFQNILWEYAEDDSTEFFMEFTDDEIKFTGKYGFEDCYYFSNAQLVDIDSNGKFFVEESEDGEVQGSSAYIKREENELWVSGVRTYQTKETYKQSTRSKNSFQPVCSELVLSGISSHSSQEF
ncbi:MAG: hypothetical protein ROO71_10065 [Balneola sp.]